jgi:hypothetical protein
MSQHRVDVNRHEHHQTHTASGLGSHQTGSPTKEATYLAKASRNNQAGAKAPEKQQVSVRYHGHQDNDIPESRTCNDLGGPCDKATCAVTQRQRSVGTAGATGDGRRGAKGNSHVPTKRARNQRHTSSTCAGALKSIKHRSHSVADDRLVAGAHHLRGCSSERGRGHDGLTHSTSRYADNIHSGPPRRSELDPSSPHSSVRTSYTCAS